MPQLLRSGGVIAMGQRTCANHGAAVVVYSDGVIHVVEPTGVRLLELAPGERLTGLIGNPAGPEVFIIVEQSSETEPVELAGSWLIMLDSSTGRALWMPAHRYFGANEGAAQFVTGGRLLV